MKIKIRVSALAVVDQVVEVEAEDEQSAIELILANQMYNDGEWKYRGVEYDTIEAEVN